MRKLYNFLFYSLLIIIEITIFPSCVSKKKIAYFQRDNISNDSAKSNINIFLKENDLLSITVLSKDPEASQPFNLSTFESVNLNSKTEGNNLKGYIVNNKGEIDFPILGNVKLAGLSIIDATDTLKNRLKKYISEPTVHIEIKNFKITILGDVLRPGTYYVSDERISILEAIGLAGDLNITGMRDNVLLIRENNNLKIEMRVDLTTKSVFNSPAFYLQQNDLIYIEPNKTKKNSSIFNPSNVTFLFSFTTLVISLLTFFNK